MTKPDEPATGFGFTTADGQSHVLENGLTKREYFASMRVPPQGESSLSVNYAKAIMKSEPPSDILENIKWWAEAEEKLSVIHADALINALNQE